MGHTLEQWRARVLEHLHSTDRHAFGMTQVDAVGIEPALAEHSVNRPRIAVDEVAGTGSALFDMPSAWIRGTSVLQIVECPARAVPPIELDARSIRIVRKTGALDVEQILLDRPVATTDYVRFWYTTSWPVPAVGDADVDLLDDLAFNAITALSASLCCTSEAVRAATAGDTRSADLITAARTYRGIYLRYLGIGDTNTNAATPVSVAFDFDPQYGSMFHGGRR